MKFTSCWTSLLALCATAVHAAPPLHTEDAPSLGAGQCEVAGQWARERADGETVRGESLDLACGAFEHTQFGIGVAQARAAQAKARAAGLGFKTRLWAAEGEGGAEVALAGTLDWVRLPDTGWERDAAEARLVVTLPGAGSLWHLNLGHLHAPSGGVNATTWGLAWELEPLVAGSTAWAPMAEAFGDDRGDRWVAAGVRWTVVADRVWLDAALSRQVGGGKARGAALGFKFAF